MSQVPDAVRAPTMTDVARVAGVSHQTVSRVLSQHPNVSPATRAAVMEVVERLGYRRNSAARALATRRTHTLGVIAANTTLHGPASTLTGVQEAARDRGYLVSAVTLRTPTQAALSEAMQHLGTWGVEGVIVVTSQRDTVRALAALDAPCPIVTVEGGDTLDLPGVSLDQNLGARMITEHLLAAGHSTVWHVAGPENWLESEARVAGWERALREAGAVVPPPVRGDWSPLSGYQAGQQLAGRVLASSGQGPGLTAVFVANDQMALGVLRAFREVGVRTPEDVAVAGFDDIPEAEFFPPPLTTIRQDFTKLGQTSIALLLDHIEGRADEPRQLTVAPELIVRASTARRRPA
ncbi:LacI family DNA-binding transcriptional regulator [Streptomyces sp. A0642]|uniref:LacI family DNA-binding transcriptional regulator n=1 Tax=Streptomyces sp. A0642 TaxID=2563100 RepID=UPI0010A21614|nr:LacI family DNA-binding transcriptional regulator [Streptomyces sp. A0642]THA79226.1 LacI family DNA-binding transcriptional regulator [Streptomyces sp. A0642]